MTKIRYDIQKKRSHKGQWAWVWVAKCNGRFATMDEAIKAAKKQNRKEGLSE